jgi:hypothetical protein
MVQQHHSILIAAGLLAATVAMVSKYARVTTANHMMALASSGVSWCRGLGHLCPRTGPHWGQRANLSLRLSVKTCLCGFPKLLTGLGADHQHWLARVPHHLVDDAAHDPTREAGVTVGRHHDQTVESLLGEFHDCGARQAAQYLPLAR